MDRHFQSVVLAVAVVAAAGGCNRVKEAREAAEEAQARAEEAAAVKLEAMELERVGEGERVETSQFAGKPWLLLAFRAGDAVCREAVGEWNGLAEAAQGVGGHLVAVVTDVEAGGEASAEASAEALEVAGAARFPVCAATRAQLDALKERAAMEVNPVAYLFDGAGRLARATEGHARLEHHAADLEALAEGRELPEHPAQGVLPEENDP